MFAVLFLLELPFMVTTSFGQGQGGGHIAPAADADLWAMPAAHFFFASEESQNVAIRFHNSPM